MTDNVVLFPSDRIVNPQRVGLYPRTNEEIRLNVDVMRNVHVSETLDVLFPMIITQLTAVGFDIMGDDNVKDVCFVLEALRSLLLKQHDSVHPFQTLAARMFEVDAEGDLCLTNNIILEKEIKS